MSIGLITYIKVRVLDVLLWTFPLLLSVPTDRILKIYQNFSVVMISYPSILRLRSFEMKKRNLLSSNDANQRACHTVPVTVLSVNFFSYLKHFFFLPEFIQYMVKLLFKYLFQAHGLGGCHHHAKWVELGFGVWKFNGSSRSTWLMLWIYVLLYRERNAIQGRNDTKLSI